jgi:hypothetical protein
VRNLSVKKESRVIDRQTASENYNRIYLSNASQLQRAHAEPSYGGVRRRRRVIHRLAHLVRSGSYGGESEDDWDVALCSQVDTDRRFRGT